MYNITKVKEINLIISHKREKSNNNKKGDEKNEYWRKYQVIENL